MRQNLAALSPKSILHLLVFFIVANLLVYIFSLNMAVWDGFRREKVQKNLRLLREDLQSREEFFVSSLTGFYEAHSGSLASPQSSEPRFVRRGENVAQAPRNSLP